MENESWSKLKKMSGPILTILVIIIINLSDIGIDKKVGMKFNNMVILIITYSVITGGFRVGLISVGLITSIYAFKGILTYGDINIIEHIINNPSIISEVLAFICVVLIPVYMERKILEIGKKLEKSEERYKKLFNLFPSMVVVYDYEYNVKVANKASENILGIKNVDKFIGQDITEYIHPSFKEQTMQRVEKLKNNEIEDIVKEEKLMKCDGTEIDVEVLRTIIPYEEENMVLMVVNDITKYKKREILLIESKNRYKTLIEFLPDGVFMHDYESIYFYNRTGAKLLGIEKESDIIGKNILNIIHPDDCEIITEQLMDILGKNIPTPLTEVRIKRKDESFMDVEITSSIILFDEIEMYLTLIRDITSKKEAEELQKSIEKEAEELQKDINNKKKQLEETLKYDKMRSDFFANMSHELRTPLHIIFSSLQMMDIILKKEEIDKKRVNKYIGIMKQNVYRQQRLVNNLIDMTKMDSGYFQIKLADYNIVNVVEEVTMSIKPYVDSKNISLLFDTNVEEKIIACDPLMIERIMLNLLSNAIKFTDNNGYIMVDVEEKEASVVITVKDTGIGIRKNEIKEIFDRFIQVNKTTIRNHEGSGIGLSLVKSLVEMHKGKIYIKSEYGKGSEFIIELPNEKIGNEEKVNMFRQASIESVCLELSDIE